MPAPPAEVVVARSGPAIDLPRATTPPTQAVIVAGGRGTRLRPLTDDRPKAMVELAGRPFLDHLLALLHRQGIERVLLLLGYRAEMIREHVGDGGTFGVAVDTVTTAPEDETSVRMRVAEDRLDEHVLYCYSDNYWPLRMDALWADYRRVGLPAMTTVYRNRDGVSRDNVEVADGRIVRYDPTRSEPDLRGVELGYAILPRATVALVDDTSRPFEKVVYPQLVAAGLLGAHETDHPYHSIGDLARLPRTERFLRQPPTLILDRDGVLNVKAARAQYVTGPEEWRWLPGAREALGLLSRAGYRLIVVSNQAGVARGAMTRDDLAAVEARMCGDLAGDGVRIEAIYYCTHDWDAGCACRKPAPGMLLDAARDHELDLTGTPFIGDDPRDGEAAAAVGAPFIRVDDEHSLLDVATRLLETPPA